LFLSAISFLLAKWSPLNLRDSIWETVETYRFYLEHFMAESCVPRKP
jgi:hypothetical protein